MTVGAQRHAETRWLHVALLGLLEQALNGDDGVGNPTCGDVAGHDIDGDRQVDHLLDQIGQLREAHGDLGYRGQAERGHRGDVELDQQPAGLSLVQIPELGNDFTEPPKASRQD